MTSRRLPILALLAGLVALAGLASLPSGPFAADPSEPAAKPDAPGAAQPANRVRPEDMDGVSFEGLSDEARKLALDLEYIGRQGILEDLRILLRTVPVMLGRRGAH